MRAYGSSAYTHALIHSISMPEIRDDVVRAWQLALALARSGVSRRRGSPRPVLVVVSHKLRLPLHEELLLGCLNYPTGTPTASVLETGSVMGEAQHA